MAISRAQGAPLQRRCPRLCRGLRRLPEPCATLLGDFRDRCHKVVRIQAHEGRGS